MKMFDWSRLWALPHPLPHVPRHIEAYAISFSRSFLFDVGRELLLGLFSESKV